MVEHCSISTISELCKDEAETVMLGGNLYQSARQFFDYGRERIGNVALVDDAFDMPTICDMASLPQLNDIFAYLATDLSDGWRIQFKDMDSYAYDMDVDHKILSVNSHGLMPHKALNANYFTPQIFIALDEG